MSHRLALLFPLIALINGCTGGADNEVVVYCALDSEFSQPIIEQYQQETGVAVRPKFDFESTKTVGLAEAIIREGDQPRCDLFWNNEILNTLRLEKEGLLTAYQSPAAESYPQEYKDADGHWHGFAGRARILIVNTDLVPAAETPDSIYDLADPRWSGRCAIAKPLFGTTATHAAVLFAELGDDEAKEFFDSIKGNVAIESGNKQVALRVANGELAFGLTDTDDAMVMIKQGFPVKIVYPDQGEDQLGTLFIPNTLAIIKNARNEEQAKKLVDYLLSPEVEGMLAKADSAQIPLNPEVTVEAQVETPKTAKAMQVDFDKAVESWDTAYEFIRENFTAE